MAAPTTSKLPPPRPPAPSKHGARPLKVLQLKGTAEVEIMEENLAIVNRLLEESGADAVSIIAVIGVYRRGKSFLLNLLLRYLRMRSDEEAARHKDADEYGDLGTADEHADGLMGCVRTAFGRAQSSTGHSLSATDIEPSPDAERNPVTAVGALWNFARRWKKRSLAGIHAPPNTSWRYGESTAASKPPWLLHGNAERIAEGALGESRHDGFHYQSGMDQCTKGIWLWSHPFVFKDKDGRRIAVLLMDTQGAWDNSMTRSQSLTILGLASLLSSKLIYNIEGLIDEQELDGLDCLTTVAQTVREDLGGIDASFGHLQILIRDWTNYEPDFTMDECKQQILKHQNQHLSIEAADNEDARGKRERLQHVFRTIRTFALCHPGLKVSKANYAGELSMINDDFLTLLDEFVKGFFAEEFPRPSAPLGCEVPLANFSSFFTNIASAFRDNNKARSAVGLRDAFVEVQCNAAKERAVAKFKRGVDRIAPERAVLSPDTLAREATSLRDTLKAEFVSRLKSWRLPESDSQARIDDLVESFDQIIQKRKAANDHMIEGATLKLVASPVVGCGAYFLFTHLWITYPVLGLGGWWQMRMHANRLGVNVCRPVVFKEVLKDWHKSAVSRWMDLQAIVVALQRLNPAEVYDSVAWSAGQLGNLAGGALAALRRPPFGAR